VPCSTSTALTEDGDLCTLFHQAAAGPAHDAKLVEWMIQLGALFNQPLHCRKEPREGELTCARELLPNTMAVHSAAIAGYEDVMMLILEADNFVDVNTPTFHTKETLAHLAVKNGHRGEYSRLHVSGADTRIKDGNGRNVWDVTSDRQWSQQMAEAAARIEESCRRGRGRKEPPRFIDGALIRLAERMRKLVFAKRDKELSLAMADLDLYDAVESKKTAKRESKKKVKRNAVPLSSPAPVPEVDTSATRKLVAALLGTARPAANTKTGSPTASGRDPMLQASLQKTMAAFARLRDPSIPVEDKAEDVRRICNVIHKLDEATEVQSDPNKMIGTGVVLRIDVSLEASRVIHMMQKFYNADRAAVSAPALAPVRELCATTLDFVKFVVRTARISLSVDRKAQAVEVFGVLEKRLLKTPFGERDPPTFRGTVQLYSKERDAMKLGRASSPDAFRRLEWYLQDAVEDPKLLSTLDKMVGRPHYFVLAMAPDTSDQQITHMRTAIGALPALEGVACFGRRRCCAMYGAASKARVAVVRKLVLETASGVGLRFDERNSRDCTASLRIGQFEFSSAGAFRNAATA
jgi:hypothetical protein